jgi:hypothetical protein
VYRRGTIVVGAACNDDLDCLSGDCCDPVDFVCIACGPAGSIAVGGTGCVDDLECDVGDYCDASGTCVVDPDAGTSATLGGACFEDADCETGEYCDIVTDTCVN